MPEYFIDRRNPIPPHLTVVDLRAAIATVWHEHATSDSPHNLIINEVYWEAERIRERMAHPDSLRTKESHPDLFDPPPDPEPLHQRFIIENRRGDLVWVNGAEKARHDAALVRDAESRGLSIPFDSRPC